MFQKTNQNYRSESGVNRTGQNNIYLFIHMILEGFVCLRMLRCGVSEFWLVGSILQKKVCCLCGRLWNKVNNFQKQNTLSFLDTSIFQFCKRKSCKTVDCVLIDMRVKEINRKFTILGPKNDPPMVTKTEKNWIKLT